MIQFVCFSRRRPLQLAGYLESLYRHCSGEFTVAVLAKVDPEYTAAYSALQLAYPDAAICGEEDFQADLTAMLGDAEFTCFGCDDVVFVEPFGVIEAIFEPSLLGLSLRLGDNITADMFGAPLSPPDMGIYWDFREPTSVGDWAYPWEVLGTVYRTDFVKEMVAAIKPGSPSQLEERGSRIWGEHTNKRLMACYPTSRLVVPTVNIVQQEFPNGIKGPKALSPEFLLDCWNQGLRLDVDRYAGMAPESWRVPDFYLKRVG